MRLKEILWIQTQRVVKKDNTISYGNKSLQIDRNKNRYSYAKAKVRVHEYADGELAIFYGHCCLSRYDVEVKSLHVEKREKAAA